MCNLFMCGRQSQLLKQFLDLWLYCLCYQSSFFVMLLSFFGHVFLGVICVIMFFYSLSCSSSIAELCSATVGFFGALGVWSCILPSLWMCVVMVLVLVIVRQRLAVVWIIACFDYAVASHLSLCIFFCLFIGLQSWSCFGSALIGVGFGQ